MAMDNGTQCKGTIRSGALIRGQYNFCCVLFFFLFIVCVAAIQSWCGQTLFAVVQYLSWRGTNIWFSDILQRADSMLSLSISLAIYIYHSVHFFHYTIVCAISRSCQRVQIRAFLQWCPNFFRAIQQCHRRSFPKLVELSLNSSMTLGKHFLSRENVIIIETFHHIWLPVDWQLSCARVTKKMRPSINEYPPYYIRWLKARPRAQT